MRELSKLRGETIFSNYKNQYCFIFRRKLAPIVLRNPAKPRCFGKQKNRANLVLLAVRQQVEKFDTILFWLVKPRLKQIR